MLRLTTDEHKASRGLSAAVELLAVVEAKNLKNKTKKPIKIIKK